MQPTGLMMKIESSQDSFFSSRLIFFCFCQWSSVILNQDSGIQQASMLGMGIEYGYLLSLGLEPGI